MMIVSDPSYSSLAMCVFAKRQMRWVACDNDFYLTAATSRQTAISSMKGVSRTYLQSLRLYRVDHDIK